MEIHGNQTEKLELEAESTAATTEQTDPLRQQTESNPPVASTTSSTTSSPSHEFSFTVSLHSSSSFFTASAANNNLNDNNNKDITNNKCPQSSTQAVDLTPADDIFFHGHLLPLHLLSSFPAMVSPRCSVDSFTIPIRQLIDEDNGNPNPDSNNKESCQNPKTGDSSICSSAINCEDTKSKGRSFNSYEYNTKYNHNQYDRRVDPKGRVKAKSFSLFGFAKRRKDNRLDQTKEMDGNVNSQENQQHQKSKMKFEVGHFLKRYIRMVSPLVFFKGRNIIEDGSSGGGGGHIQHNYQTPPRQSYSSYSGTLSPRIGVRTRGGRRWDLMRKRSGQFSAPASMRTSPTNSGILIPPSEKKSKTLSSITHSTSDSTMEELQAAIQAAIAHCKNSRALQEIPTIVESQKTV